MGINIDDETLHTLLFADDQIIIAEDEDDINYTMRKLTETYEKWGLKINFDKTKYIVVGGNGRDLHIDGKVIKACREYKYLGVLITEEGNCQKEIRNRIIQTKQVTQKLNSLLWSNELRIQTKKRIYNTMVKSILTYGSETWEVTKRNKDRLLATEMDFLRRSCGVSRLQHIRNEEIRRRMDMEETIIEEIEKKRLLWYGHMRRMQPDRWPQRIWAWRPPERRKRGRPPRTWDEDVREAMNKRQLEENLWEDRVLWHLGCETRPQ